MQSGKKKTSAAWDVKGITKKLYPSALCFMKPNLHTKLGMYISAMVCFLNKIKKVKTLPARRSRWKRSSHALLLRVNRQISQQLSWISKKVLSMILTPILSCGSTEQVSCSLLDMAVEHCGITMIAFPLLKNMRNKAECLVQANGVILKVPRG